MRWLELIHLRPTETKHRMPDHLATLRPALAATPNLVEARIYAQAGVGGDVAVHLMWTSGDAFVRTRLGLTIAESLRAFGLVDHSTWKEETP